MGNNWTEKELNEKQAKGHIKGWQVTNHKPAKKKPKYKNQKVIYNGVLFDSKKECGRYLELKMMQAAGLISDLRLQVSFVLIEPNGKERGCKYIADFTYMRDVVLVVEDVKSKATRKLSTYILKRKLMLEKHGIKINEV